MKPLVFRKSRRVRRRQSPPARVKLHLTKGDTVRVISGDDKGKQGRILAVYPKTGRIKVEGVNVVTRHLRATPTREAGKVRSVAPIHHSKAMLVDPKTGEPTRIRRRRDADGTLERIGVRSGQPIPRSR
jgi:large subunit ribosomal protein L24